MDNRFISNLLRGLVSTSFGSIVTVGFHFLSIVLMTRYVPKDVLGLYFLALAVVLFLKVISGLGLDLTLTKFVSGGDRRQQQDATASTVAVRLASVASVGLIFYAAGQLLLPVFDTRLSDGIMLMILLLVLTSFRDLLLCLMQGMQQFKQYAVVEVLSAASRVILLIACRVSLSLQVLLYIEIISQLTEVLLQLFVTRALLFSLSRQNITTPSVRKLTRFSAPLYSNNILALVYDRSSTLLIGALLNPASVAAYEVALKIPDGFTRLFDSFIVVYFPNLSNLFAKGSRDDAKRIMNSSLVLISAGIIFLVLVAFLFADEIILAVFSNEYLEVALAFALLMLNFYLRAISNILGYSLVAAGHSSAPVKANIVACLVNIISSLMLIRTLGYIGAIYSLLLMNITAQIIYLLLLRRIRLVPHVFEYLKPVFFLAVEMGIYWYLRVDSAWLQLLLVGTYITASWALIKEIRESSHFVLRYVFQPRVRAKPAE